MNNLGKKQKIIILILILFAVVTVIYVYLKVQNKINEDGEEEFNNLISNNVENSTVNNTKDEEQKNDKAKIIVHISGEVKSKGILELEEGARIDDAIKKAGGVTENANLDNVNLAYMLEDGVKIYIPSKKDSMEGNEYITKESGNNVISKESEKKNEKNKQVNINTATKKDLEELPGIGSEMAERIVDYRAKNGKFTKIDDLKNVKGIGDSKFSKIKEFISVK